MPAWHRPPSSGDFVRIGLLSNPLSGRNRKALPKLQELLFKIPTKKFHIPKLLNYLKYGMLAFFVILLPFFAVDEFGAGEPWYCKYICPAGTLEAGIPMLILQPQLRASIGLLFYNKLFIAVAVVVWSIIASRPFCRTLCPLGAFYALFSKTRIVKLRLDEGRCTQCKACHRVCPMEVKFNEDPDSPECISCLACMNEACKFDAITMEIGGVPLGLPTHKTSQTAQSQKFS